jgi:hypothetical protein
MRSTAITAQAAPACTAPARAASAARQPAVPRRQVARRAIEAPGAVEVPPVSDEVAAKMAELNIDFERSGLKYLPNEARVSQPASPRCLRTYRPAGPTCCRAAGATARALASPALPCPAHPQPSPHSHPPRPLLSTCLPPCSFAPWTASPQSLRRPRTKSAGPTCGATSPSWRSSSGELQLAPAGLLPAHCFALPWLCSPSLPLFTPIPASSLALHTQTPLLLPLPLPPRPNAAALSQIRPPSLLPAVSSSAPCCPRLCPLPCRDGKSTWEDLNLDDVDVRLKWAGLFHRRKRTPGRFMMRLKVS